MNNECVKQYGGSTANLNDFSTYYKNKPLDEIVYGSESYFGYEFPNKINKDYRFVTLNNGEELDMIHFFVVGQRGHILGMINKTKQLYSSTQSAFYSQDFYSNRLGVNFFALYRDSIKKNPGQISIYVNSFLSKPANTNLTPPNLYWKIEPKY